MLVIKSMFSTTSCVCNLGSLKVHLFFCRRQRKRLLRKVPIYAWFIHFSVACAMSATRVHGLQVNANTLLLSFLSFITDEVNDYNF